MKSRKNFLFGLAAGIAAVFCSSIVQPVSAQICYDSLIDNFRIRRIDLYDSMYIIYAQRGDSIFKIYSRQEMERPQGGEILRVGETYRLCLYPLFSIGTLRSSLILYGHFGGRAVRYEYSPADYCVRNLFSACNIFDKCVYPDIPDSIRTSVYNPGCPYLRAPKTRLPKDIEKIRRGNAANPRR